MTYTYHKVAYDLSKSHGSIVADRKRKKITVCASLNDEKEAAIAILSGNSTEEKKRLELSNGAADVDSVGNYMRVLRTLGTRAHVQENRGALPTIGR